jgi:hypothetical protein
MATQQYYCQFSWITESLRGNIWQQEHSWGQCNKTFYCSNLPPFLGNTVILCYKAILPWKLPWNGSKLLRYFNPRKSKVRSTAVIYYGIVL